MRQRVGSLSDLPWDTIYVVFDFTPKEQYPSFRLNRTFTRLINKRRRSLCFKEAEVPPRVFQSLLKTCEPMLTSLQVKANLKFVKKRDLDSWQVRLRRLRDLDLSGFHAIPELTFARLIESA